jgi:hypothetical protein
MPGLVRHGTGDWEVDMANRLRRIWVLACVVTIAGGATVLAADDPSPPSDPLKLVLIHHSCGENWLADDHGGLGLALRDNGYFVSDTNYGWGPVCEDCEDCWGAIGDCTDILHWDNWFGVDGEEAPWRALVHEFGQASAYSRMNDPHPDCENDIVLFKSCYPNSNLAGSPDEPPAAGHGLTVGHAKSIYLSLLDTFALHTDKLFIAITAPPVTRADSWEDPANARAFNDWLVHEWLGDYPYENVAVFDFFNVLTSNGGDPVTHDVEQEAGNHHRWWNGSVQHVQTLDNDLAAYPDGDSHPTPAGNQKATAEFVPLLNVWLNRWLADRP